jgi:hypothetical protein
MDPQTALLVTWLEQEGERYRQPFLLPRRAGDSTFRGWIHLWVCILGGILVAGLLVCWLIAAWRQALLVGAGPASLGDRNFRAGKSVTLQNVRVERIARPAKVGNRIKPWALTVRGQDFLLVCEFREEHAPRNIQVGDIVSISSAAGRDEQETMQVLLKDCTVIAGPIRADE